MANINLQRMHKISIIWGIIMMLLVLALTLIAISYKKETKEYKAFEIKLEEATKNYIEQDGLYPEEEMYLTLAELLKLNIIETNVVKDKTCQGYVDIKNDEQFFDYEAYIKCGNYETKNLDKKKLDD